MFAPHRYRNATSQVSDPNFENVSLLLHGDGTNGAQNNTFLDSSTNNFTITRNGTPTQGSFSPYGNSWSNYFNGVSSLISTKSSALNFGVGNLTIEGWVNPSTIALNQYYCIFSFGAPIRIYIINSRIEVYFNDSDDGISYIVNGLTGPLNSISANTWNHFAVVRNGNTFTVYVNGIAGTPATGVTQSIFYSSANPRIGRYDATLYPYFGNISNLRIVKGTALYTSNFTPPTSPLTSVAGTSLLTCQSNRFIDNSSNNFAITANGTPTVQPNSPFNPTSEYSITANGGSVYFPGVNGNSISAPTNTSLNLTGNFTIECWLLVNSLPSYQIIWDTSLNGGAGANMSEAWVDSSGAVTIYSRGITICTTTTNSIKIGTWNHIAFTRNANTYSIWINGILSATATFANSIVSGYSWYIGDRVIGAVGGNYPINGYISNFRIVNGTAIYTSNFTPPTSPVTAVANTSLLCNFTNAGIFDNAAKNNLLTVGTARVSTAEKKFGTGSMYFDVTDDRLTMVSNQDFAFGTSNFTVEFWAYSLDVLGSTQRGFLQTSDVADGLKTTYTSGIAFGQGANAVGAKMNGGLWANIAGTIVGSNTPILTTSTWYHIALVRNSGIASIYVNGVLHASASATGNCFGTNLCVGGYYNTSYLYNGYIDDLRITKSIARYTANFTPPTQAFPNL